MLRHRNADWIRDVRRAHPEASDKGGYDNIVAPAVREHLQSVALLHTAGGSSPAQHCCCRAPQCSATGSRSGSSPSRSTGTQTQSTPCSRWEVAQGAEAEGEAGAGAGTEAGAVAAAGADEVKAGAVARAAEQPLAQAAPADTCSPRPT